MGGNAPNLLADAMNRLWVKHLPQLEHRVLILRQAAHSLGSGALATPEQAAAEAHKLAGVLGTFGLTEGTELAREAETLCQGPLNNSAVGHSRLNAIADRLQTLISQRTQTANTSESNGV